MSEGGRKHLGAEWEPPRDARCISGMRRLAVFLIPGLLIALGGCASAVVPPSSAASQRSTISPSAPVPARTRVEHLDYESVVTGTPIEIGELSGRIVTDDFEDVFAFNVDGSDFVRIADNPAGPEFDPSWSPDGKWVVYRDSTRGTNENDEVFIASADGTKRRNLSRNPANDWGPDWSPDGGTIVFNSDRDQESGLRGYLVDADGSHLRRIDADVWIEYPSWSPDAKKLAFMGALGSNYEVFVLDLETSVVKQLTDSPGHDAWPAWSPDGSTIAFSSVRDDCRVAPSDAECWRTSDIGEHFDVWTIGADGTDLKR